jgi:hypothetical protein
MASGLYTQEQRTEHAAKNGYGALPSVSEHQKEVQALLAEPDYVVPAPVVPTQINTHNNAIKAEQANVIYNGTLQPAEQSSPTSITGIALSIIMLVVAVIVLVLLLRLIVDCIRALLGRVTATASTCTTAISKRAEDVGSVWFLTVLRGRLVVRASTYLMALSQEDATTISANRLASSIDTYAANQLRHGAMFHVNEVFNGSRLALISEARLRGFNG